MKQEQAPLIRAGDLRYSYVHHVKDYSAIAPLGAAAPALDPRSGEIISGVANIYSWNDYVANQIKEAVQLLNGQLDPQTYVDGEDLSPLLEAIDQQAGTSSHRQKTSTKKLRQITQSN